MVFMELAAARVRMSKSDVAESRQLLWELVTHEPTVLHCFGVVQAACLSQGLRCSISGRPCSAAFQGFLDTYYTTFCRAAIEAFFTYGFVPWHTRRNRDGDLVPEVLPAGTFTWGTEVADAHNTATRVPGSYGLVVYTVQVTASIAVKEKDVRIYEYVNPTLNVATASFLHATVVTPFANIIIDYKHLRQAQIRRSYADAWNTTAKLICTYSPAQRVQEEPGASLMDFADETSLQGMFLGLPGMPDRHAANLWQRDKAITRQFEGVGTHQPDVFTLPRDHGVVQQQRLDPCEDLPLMQHKFQQDVGCLMRVPAELLEANTVTETTQKTVSTGKLFTSNMWEICKHLQCLLGTVYDEIYGRGAPVQFKMVPTPRLEVQSMQDLKILFEIGVLTKRGQIGLEEVLLGPDICGGKRPKLGHGKRSESEPAVGPADNAEKAGPSAAVGGEMRPTIKREDPASKSKKK